MTQGSTGFGTIIKRGNGAGTAETFAAIPEVVGDIEGPALELSTVEATNHDSVNAMREYKPGLINPGEVSFAVNYIVDDTQHEGLQSDLASRVLRNFQIEWPDGYTIQFAALVTKWAHRSGLEEMIQREVTLKISGAVTEVP
jgi:hypothetical protein